MQPLGFNAVGWELGRNLGGLDGMRARLRDKVAALRQAAGSAWSDGVWAGDMRVTWRLAA